MATEDEIRRRVRDLFDEIYGGMPQAFETQRWPGLSDEELHTIEQSLLSERERKKLKAIEQAREQEEDKIISESVPREIYELFDVKIVYGNDAFTRYVWGSKEEIEQSVINGVEMNEGHDALPTGWNYLHVGDEAWIAVLSRDYGRSGDVCEIEISDLPDGFFLIEDTDIMDKTDTPNSDILISTQKVIPRECVTITRVLDTDEVVENYPQYDNYEESYS